MISVETPSFKNSMGTKVTGIGEMKILNRNRSNGTQTHPIEIAKDEEIQIRALENNIIFLRSQHEIMLKSLHDEVEHLRKLNKALQFRLVMCCCANADEQKANKRACNKSENEMQNEVVELKGLLEEERKKNETLQKQLESIHNARSIASEERAKHQSSPGTKVKTEPEQSGVKNRSESLRRTTNDTRTPKQTKEKTLLETTDTSKHGRTSHKDAAGNRILSPELNPDSSSSAILLTPRTTIGMPDGFWVRPSVASLQNKLLPTTGTTPRGSVQPGSQLMPVKLPVLRNSNSMNQAINRDTTKDVLGSTVKQADTPGFDNTKEGVYREQKNQSNAMKNSRSARTCLGHNGIAIYDPLHDSPPSTTAAEIRSATRSYAPNLGPFLPALPKTKDTGQTSRTRKTRETQRKRLNMTHNWFPS